MPQTAQQMQRPRIPALPDKRGPPELSEVPRASPRHHNAPEQSPQLCATWGARGAASPSTEAGSAGGQAATSLTRKLNRCPNAPSP
eukprot:CAMPEP_0174321592 /NCGR_PEP_ID=MMETSP0810-20121108/10420_1 /TAXON_ID=73025 ORGANISM="Eutreptiella gymnastica-like, Strain CCMP1594" /NCGR_SAMPLE_ID=MMETSP0810 /ASSEMBLY_ACC=CAM_ASM_000659 /LENGTH=85 /DNA_ID=CAMNT_0015433091 /DNA_START=33 /DNA_END=291 /DNA_ORIENTATION=+